MLKMKRSEFNRRLLGGLKVHMVEYRGSKPDHIRWRSKETKQVEEMDLLNHNCESSNGEAFMVAVRVEKDAGGLPMVDGVAFNPATYVAPFRRGQQVVLEYSGCTITKGNCKYNGLLYALEEDGAPDLASVVSNPNFAAWWSKENAAKRAA